MKFKLPKISPGVGIATLGVLAILIGLSFPSNTFLDKLAITIFGMGFIILGALIETPILGYLKDKPDEDNQFRQN